MPKQQRRRRADAEIVFNGKAVSPDLLPSLWREGERLRYFSRYRMDAARGVRLKTQTIQLKQSWVRRNPEAADWVIKVLPERRTLERDLIASAGAIEPYYDRVAIGKGLDSDFDRAEATASYMETWRKDSVPYQAFLEKGVEDGQYGVVVLPSSVDMDGCPDFYDRLDEQSWAALDAEEADQYAPDEADAKGRYTKRNDDGSMRPNPKYDRNAEGKPRAKDDKSFIRNADKSREAHDLAVQRYLLNQEQGAVSVRVVPANDCVPYLIRGAKRDRWKPFAMLERTLYYPEELISQGHGWRGMGDRLLIPNGFDRTRTTGQNGMFYLYTLYLVWTDPKDPLKIQRPLIIYSVGGQPSWSGGEPSADELMPDNGVAVIDLYETHGLTGPCWGWFGGLHTSDDDSDFYYEPYLWPFVETIFGLEGLGTMANAAVAVQAVTGYYHKPDAALMALDDEGLADDKGVLVVPEIPDAGEIKTIFGDIIPAQPAIVSPDLWRVIANEQQSLRANTMLEQPGSGEQASGRSMVVRETIAQTTKRHTREGARDAVNFCGETALRILYADATIHDLRWPLQTTQEKPVGSEMRAAANILEFDPEWIGDGEFRLTCEYPNEENPVRVEQAMSKIQAGVGSFEELCAASGITDVESEWARVIKTQMRMSQEYRTSLMARLAKRQGNKLMQQVIKLQQQQRMTQGGAPGYPTGIPTATLNGPGEQAQTPPGIGSGGPTTAQRSLGGIMSSALGPPMGDAHAQIAAGQGAAV